MARGTIVVTPGVGENVATETDAGSRKMQVVVVGIPGLDSMPYVDLDTGGGTALNLVHGILGAAAGGPQAIPGDASNGLWANIKQMPGAGRTTDGISVFHGLDVIMDGLAALTIKFAKANVAASQTDANLVTAVASKQIVPILLAIHAGGTGTNITFNSKPAGAGTAISALYAMGANGGRERGFAPCGFFRTVAGEGLTCTTGAGSTTGIDLAYVER